MESEKVLETVKWLKMGTEELNSNIREVAKKAVEQLEETPTRVTSFENEIVVRFSEMIKELDEGVGELLSKGSITYQNLVTLQQHVKRLETTLGMQGEMTEVKSYNVFMDFAVSACGVMDSKIELILEVLEQSDQKIKQDKVEIKSLSEKAYTIAKKIYSDPLFGSRFAEDTTNLFNGLIDESRIENKWRFATDIKYYALELAENISVGSIRNEAIEIGETMTKALTIIDYYISELG